MAPVGPPDAAWRPFTVAEAPREGLSPARLRSSDFRSPFRGVRVAADAPETLETRCAAAQRILDDAAAFSHETAASLLGIPCRARGGTGLDVLDVTMPRGTAVPRTRGLRGHDTIWRAGDVITWRDLRVTCGARTLCDLAAAGSTRADLLVMADALLSGGLRHAPLSTRVQLLESVTAWRGRRGLRRLTEVVHLASERVDSPMESVLRLLILDAGLPPPWVNQPVRDGHGNVVHRPDLSWPTWRVAVEYDGAHHFEGDAARLRWRRRQDVARVELMQDLGWTVRVMTRDDLFDRPTLALKRIRVALRDRGADV